MRYSQKVDTLDGSGIVPGYGKLLKSRLGSTFTATKDRSDEEKLSDARGTAPTTAKGSADPYRPSPEERATESRIAGARRGRADRGTPGKKPVPAAAKTSESEAGWLPGVIRKPSGRVGRRRKGSLIGTVIHATKAGKAGAAYLREDVSWHFTINRDGTVCQHVSIFDTAAHTGAAKMFLEDRFVREKVLNPRTLGIELANWLAVVKRGPGFRIYDHKTKKVLDRSPMGIGDTVQIGSAEADGATVLLYWEQYPSVQIESLKSVLEEIAKAGWPEVLTLIDHEDISPGRKIDPGPAYPHAQMVQWAHEMHAYYGSKVPVPSEASPE